MNEQTAFFVLSCLTKKIRMQSGAEAGFNLVEVETVACAKGEHHRVVVALGEVEGLSLEGKIALFYLFYIYMEVGDVPLATCDVVGMGGGSYAHIRRGVPVAAVMTGAAAWSCKVADFIMLISGIGETVDEVIVHAAGKLVVGFRHLALGEKAVEWGALLVGEAICREMLHVERQGCGDVGIPLVEGLVGETVDEVNADVVDAGCAQAIDSTADVGSAMAAAKETQARVVEGLRPHADTVDGQRGEQRGEGGSDIVGIALDGNLRGMRAVDAGEEALELVGWKSAWRAPSDIDSLPFGRAISGAQIHLSTECRHVFFCHAGGGCGIERTIDAT